MRDLTRLITPVAVPALHLVRCDAPTRSHLGGAPRLPAGVAWPEKNGRRLDFLARLSLPEAQRSLAMDWLPQEGALLFFYDEQQPWGFRPDDRGGWAVLHVPDLASPVDGGGRETPLPHRSVEMRPIAVLPSTERPQVEQLRLSDDEIEVYDEIVEAVHGGRPRHQLGGLPAVVQGDEMELQCQLTSNGLFCGDHTGYEHARAEVLRPGTQDWRLLLQVDSDEDLGVMWGDLGTVYYWVREPDARRGAFDDVWLVLQCS